MQGETCDKLRIDLNQPQNDLGETYTALSRVRKLNDIMIINLDKSRFKRHYELSAAKQENYKSLQEEILRLKTLSNQTFSGLSDKYIPLSLANTVIKKRTLDQFKNDNNIVENHREQNKRRKK